MTFPQPPQESPQNLTANSAIVAAGERELAARITEFQQQRQLWEHERQQALADIQQQSCLLKDAWLRLEQEQRGVLKSTNTSAGSERPSRSATHNSLTDNLPLNATSTDNAELDLNHACSPSPAEQFQLLQQHVLRDKSGTNPTGSTRITGESP